MEDGGCRAGLPPVGKRIGTMLWSSDTVRSVELQSNLSNQKHAGKNKNLYFMRIHFIFQIFFRAYCLLADPYPATSSPIASSVVL